jgi:hypothetical protein
MQKRKEQKTFRHCLKRSFSTNLPMISVLINISNLFNLLGFWIFFPTKAFMRMKAWSVFIIYVATNAVILQMLRFASSEIGEGNSMCSLKLGLITFLSFTIVIIVF